MTTDQMRILCRHLIDTMPEDGLEETLSTLRDYYAFYLTPKPEPLSATAANGQSDG